MAKENNKKIIENITQSLINRVFVKSEQPNWDVLKNFARFLKNNNTQKELGLNYLLATPL